MKNNIALLFLLIVILAGFDACSEHYEYPFRNPKLSVEKRVDDLIGRLTLEEKVSQMMNSTPAIDRLGIPPYDWWNEALHGVARAGLATVFPQAIALAATFDEESVYQTFDVISDEARAKYHHYQKNKEYDRYKGLTFWTPNINIFRDPRWGRGMETYGEDPYLTGVMGVAAVKGLQGDDPRYFKTHACAKHYAVHSGPEWNRHEFDVTVSSRDLRETYLPAFHELVKANVQEVMCAYNRLDGAPCCGSNFLLNDILRQEWKYEGIVVSDCGAIDDFWRRNRHETHENALTASVDAIRTGTDLECGQSYRSVLEALKSGQISEDEVDVALRRLFRGRFELGMFDSDDRVKWSKIPYSVVDSKEHRQKALEMARKSMVLLKNSQKTLPLSKEIKKIAVVGPNANDSVMLWANYNGFPSSTVTILKGITQKLPGKEVIYEKGCELTEEYVTEEFSDAVGLNGKKGFEAKYYNNIHMEGDPIQKEMTQSIRYTTTGNTQFANNVPLNNFSAVYTGNFKAPVSGTISFTISGDDGYRLYINDQLAFEDWGTHAITTKAIEKEVKKGESYQLRIEYFQAGGDGHLEFTVGEKKLVDFSRTVQKVKDADAIVFVGGISPMLEGEEMGVDIEGFRKGDRTNIELPAVQKRMLEELRKIDKPLIFILCSGSAIALNWADQHADAILNAWYGGQAAGTAVADILFGDYNPAGRLPVTFYTSVDQLGDFEDYSMQGRTYRYMEQSPVYPFGHGLSYTTFDYRQVSLSKDMVKLGKSVDLNIDLHNTGAMDGDEVVQVYVRNNADKDGPVKSLRAFKRVSVPAGSSAKVKINLKPAAFESYYEDTERMETRSGNYTIFVGGSSSGKGLIELPFTIE
jgi:beta-glucosidase